MKFKKYRITLVLFTLLVTLISIEAKKDYARITFIKGKTKLKLGRKRIWPRVGRKVSLKTKIKTYKRSSITFLYKKQTIRIGAKKKGILKSYIKNRKVHMSYEANMFGNLLRRPKGSIVMSGPTKVAGVRGKAGSKSSNSNTNTSSKTNIKKYYYWLDAGNFDGLVKSLKKTKVAEEKYILGLTYYAQKKSRIASKTLKRALKLKPSIDLKAKIRLALATILTQKGRYRYAVKQLKKIEKSIDKKKVQPEVWYLLYQNNKFMAKDKKSKRYSTFLSELYPNHELTKLISDNQSQTNQ